MTRPRKLALFLVLTGFGSLVAKQERPRLDALLRKLCDSSTSSDAEKDLLKIAKSDPTAKTYVVERLPALLESYGDRGNQDEDYAWGYAAALAGELGAVDAIPILCKRFDLRTPGWSNMTGDRPAVWALVLIGDPAVPCAADYLKKGTPERRWQAASILGHIETDGARRALQEQLLVETDHKIRSYIEWELTRNRTVDEQQRQRGIKPPP